MENAHNTQMYQKRLRSALFFLERDRDELEKEMNYVLVRINEIKEQIEETNILINTY